MEKEIMNRDIARVNSRLTTPRAAAVAGIVFSILLMTSLVIIRISVPMKPGETGDWLSGNWRNVELALNLLPFSGIAFLWFIGVIRDRLGDSEDRFFSTVFFGSGLLFLATLFTSAAVAGGIITMYGTTPGELISNGVYTYGRAVTYEVVNVYSMKMAGVFMMSTSTLSLRTGIIPRWMAILGFLSALFLLLSLNFFVWAPIVFPLWILLISIHILVSNLKTNKSEPVPAEPPLL
jgi:hypothetical protein